MRAHALFLAVGLADVKLDRHAGDPHRSVMDVPAELITFASELAAIARKETLGRFADGVAVGNKGATLFDPVTAADREAERAMRLAIADRYPDHGISGEEWPDEPARGPWRWSLDPVDGTRSFICGLPTWVTLIGLLHQDRPVLGVIDAPVLDETYVGANGATSLRGSALRTSGCATLARTRLATTDPLLMFDGAAAEAFERMRRAAPVTRFGHDGYAYARLAAGGLDLVIEAGLKPYDYNALVPVVRGAGGVIGDWRGGSDFSAGRVIAAASQALYDEALGYFADVA